MEDIQAGNVLAAPKTGAGYHEKQWYAVYTTYRHEKRVADHFANRGIEHYLPLYCAHSRWKDGSGSALDLPLFPCYVFVRIAREERIPVLQVPGALWMVGNAGSEPTPLPELEIETLRTALDSKRAEPHPYLSAGQRVRIRGGMFAGLEGILARRKNSLHVIITLELIMQSIAIEVSPDDLESIGQAAALPRSSAFPFSKFALCRL